MRRTLARSCLIYWRLLSQVRNEFSVRTALGTLYFRGNSVVCSIAESVAIWMEWRHGACVTDGPQIGFRELALYFLASELVLRRTASSMRTPFPTQLPELGLDRIVRPPPLAAGSPRRRSAQVWFSFRWARLLDVFSPSPSGILIEVFHVN
jgi:hypothetical protein